MTPRLPTESLLVFSDVHLGSDLNDSGPVVPRSAAIDRDLTEMLAHYRRLSPPADRWRLVIAGDFVDFVGMSIDPRSGDVLETEPTSADRAFGLGGAEDHVRLKLKRAAERHPDVFAELGAFVAEGHALTVILGNHDLELHWESVQADFCALLTPPYARRDDIVARTEFLPWFFHREGVVYIEHGHQYDPFCATPHVFAPLSPRDPRRILQSASDTLLRCIVRRTPGMREYGHETRGLTSYITWGLMLGAAGTVSLFKRFVRAVTMLHGTARAFGSELGARIREEHERRLARFANKMRIPMERLRSALALQAEPIGKTARGVLTSVMLDRLGVFVVMVVALAAIALFHGVMGSFALYLAASLLLVWTALHMRLARARPSVDPGTEMRRRVGALAKLFPSSFVVMGHTHVPTSEPVGDAVYINLGSWAEEEPDPNRDPTKAYRAARTHLLVHTRHGRNEAHLCEWRSGEGPRELSVAIRFTHRERDEADEPLAPPIEAAPRAVG